MLACFREVWGIFHLVKLFYVCWLVGRHEYRTLASSEQGSMKKVSCPVQMCHFPFNPPTLPKYFKPDARPQAHLSGVLKVADPIPYRCNASPSPFTPNKKPETSLLLIQSVFSERARAASAANPPREVNRFAHYYASFAGISNAVDLTSVWGKGFRSSQPDEARPQCVSGDTATRTALIMNIEIRQRWWELSDNPELETTSSTLPSSADILVHDKEIIYTSRIESFNI